MKSTVALSLALLLAATLAGCGGQSGTYDEPAEAETATMKPADEAMPASFEMTEELESKLAAADLVDGTEDKVVSNCPGCSLAMEGSDEHALAVGDYSLHFCSDSCKENFEKDVAESLTAMNIPEK